MKFRKIVGTYSTGEPFYTYPWWIEFRCWLAKVVTGADVIAIGLKVYGELDFPPGTGQVIISDCEIFPPKQSTPISLNNQYKSPPTEAPAEVKPL